MSTILEALKKLEHDKHVEATAEGRAHDPLAPAPTPAMAREPASRERSRVGWIATAAVLTFVIGLAVGFFTLTPDELDSSAVPLGAQASSPGSASDGSAPISPLMARAAEVRSRSRALSVEARSQVIAPSIEARSSGQAPDIEARSRVPAVFAATSGPARPAVGAAPDKPAPQPDPWEAAGLAADGDDERAEPDPVSRTAADASPTASPGMLSAPTSTGFRPAAPGAAPPAVAAAPPPAPTSVSRQPSAGIPRGAVPIESLPDTDLSTRTESSATSTAVDTGREPAPQAAPPVATSATATLATATLATATPATATPATATPAPVTTTEPAPTSAAESSSQPAAAARPGLGDVVVSDTSERFEVKVLKTVWHPKPDRRSARLELSSGGEVLVVEEGDTLSGYRVDAITPSTVVLSKGGVTVTHRVGR